MTDTDVAAAASARELLRDSFTRIIEHVGEVTAGLPDSALTYRPTPDANSTAWGQGVRRRRSAERLLPGRA
ncbi:hypothetical protein HNP40_000067 [Mycobacteroides chelonae]|nr:hypothetical protein [Mycobacteroides chelonae]